MEKKLAAAAERYLSFRHQNKRRTQMLRCVAVLVVLATISALVMPALTMSNEVECGLTEHVHTESCWSEQLAMPEPELACTVGASGEVVIHTHDEYCYDSQGNLICKLPEAEAHVHGAECYQEHRTLICGQTAELGHQHDASCYAYVRTEGAVAENVSAAYTCGMQEGEGAHRHTEECYPEERAAEPLCGLEEAGDEYDDEGNLLWQGHRHTEECWMVRVHEKLVCGLEEAESEYDEEGNLIREGHTHAGSCWLTGDELCLRYGCGQRESAGHAHTDACTQGSVRVDSQGEQWEQVLTCEEQEREAGHVHTDECYEITQVLTCRKQELAVHTHSADCYGEDGALICGQTGALAHQHTEACFTAPEGGPEPTRVLICGMEEHTHTDLCYVKVLPEEEAETFYCGQEEHLHTAECYFPSGALKCTLAEHVHDIPCEMPPMEEAEEPGESDAPGESQPPENSGQEDMSQIWVDGSYVHETEAFRVIFQVTGWAKPAVDSQEAGTVGNELWTGDFAPGVVSTPSYEEGLVELVSQRIPLAALPAGVSASLDPDALPGADPFAENNQSEADTGPAGPVGSVVEDNRPAPSKEPVQLAPREENEPVVLPTPEITPSLTPIPEISPEPVPTPEAAEQLELVVEQLVETDPEYQRAAANAQVELGEEESTVVDVLRIALYAGEQKMDLSGCEVTAVVEASQELKDALEAQEAVTADEDGPQAEDMEDTEEQEEPSFVMTDEQGVVMAFSKLNEAMEVEVTDDIVALSAVPSKVYPNFKVEYYAYLETVYTTESKVRNSTLVTETGGLPILIDTSREGPSNDTGENLPSKGLPGPNSGALWTFTMSLDDLGNVTTNADKDEMEEIFNPHRFNYETAPRLNYVDIVTREGGHYTLAEILVMKMNGEEAVTDKIYKYSPESQIQLTNNPRTAAENPDKYILIQEDTLLRMVYRPTSTNEPVDANFFDYDISDGKVYTSASASGETVEREQMTGGTKYYMYTGEQGINSAENYKTDGKKLAFGNNMPTGLQEVTDEKGQTINKGNAKGFGNCSFGMVGNTLSNGKLQFANGIAAPDLFSKDTDGSTYYEGGLSFTRKGDTYTLSAASVKDGEKTSQINNLDKLAYSRKNWNKTQVMYSNEFWPLDKVRSAGAADHDLVFGTHSGQYYLFDGKTEAKTLTSDYSSSGAPTNEELKDGAPHNPYFGMTFSVDFTLYPDYIGPLEYYFFGDDDMWVYLTDKSSGNSKLICDIGGVHSSVGEYVNLWDYIDKNKREVDDTEGVTDASLGDKKEYTLTFFYTERGASGSTCWMQFTLPELRSSTFRTPTSDEYATLEVEKVVEGPETEAEFNFILEVKDANGNTPPDLVPGIYKSNGSAGELEKVEEAIDFVNGKWGFSLKDGQAVVIKDLPAGMNYTITELNQEGYITSFKTLDQNAIDGTMLPVISTDGTSVSGTLTGGHIIKVMCINSASYELPSTGGTGAWYTMAGLPLTAAMLCLWYRKKSKGEGGGG